MKRNMKYMLLALLIMIAVAGWYAYSEYTRKPADLAAVPAAAHTHADSLVALYEMNEPKANELYLGKVIDVSGSIAEFSNQQDTMINIILTTAGDMHRVSCQMNVKHKNDLKRYKSGDNITIRGVCTGYLIDVELNRCIVVPQ